MAQSSAELPCPGCGFLIYGPEAYGSYGICPLCNWEDCPVQFANPLDVGGPNRESLVMCQSRAIARWPLDVRSIIEEGDHYDRDSRWRPLSTLEIDSFICANASAQTTLLFQAIFTIEDCYWMKSSGWLRENRARRALRLKATTEITETQRAQRRQNKILVRLLFSVLSAPL